MLLPYRDRNRELVWKPTRDDDFQVMCVDIYRQVYGDPGAGENGRTGQRQHGRDLFVTDWAGRDGQRTGRVWVQCKQTAKEEPSKASVCKDIIDANKRASVLVDEDRAYLFIIATTAPNSAGLHDAIEELKKERFEKGEADLLFRVEIATWDVLCDHVREHDTLWVRYNTSPHEGLAPEFRRSADHLAATVDTLTSARRFKDAKDEIEFWRRQQPIPGHLPPPPADAWTAHTVLRHKLLTLYGQAHDSVAALPLLSYESTLTHAKDARALLDYILAERTCSSLQIVAGLSSPAPKRMAFDDVLVHESANVFTLEGPPDELACLALLLILEVDRVDLHEQALKMMNALVARCSGTAREIEARIAGCIVRYYFVARHGWTGSACRYHLGDQLSENDWIFLVDERLDQHFDVEVTGAPTIIGRDPLDRPERNAYLPERLFTHLIALYLPEQPFVLPRLRVQCKLYTVTRVNRTTSSEVPSNYLSFSGRRVIDAEAALGLAASGLLPRMLDNHILMATELTFIKLIAYRSVLRGYLQRVGHADAEQARLYEAVSEFVEACRAGAPAADKRRIIWIMSVYDNPPMLLAQVPVGAALWRDPRWPFTLSHDALRSIAPFVAGWHTDQPNYHDLMTRYQARNDDFCLSCLLALHKSAPILVYSYKKSVFAQNMGIGSEHAEAEAILVAYGNW